MPTFLAKKEVFKWLEQGQKTIDIRRGNPRSGEKIIFISGPHRLELKVVQIQSGRLSEVVRQDNFSQVIPSATRLEDAFAYLRGIFGCYDGVFTAYTVAQ
jgi:ASC-1-like (ASCH) protein